MKTVYPTMLKNKMQPLVSIRFHSYTLETPFSSHDVHCAFARVTGKVHRALKSVRGEAYMALVVGALLAFAYNWDVYAVYAVLGGQYLVANLVLNPIKDLFRNAFTYLGIIKCHDTTRLDDFVSKTKTWSLEGQRRFAEVETKFREYLNNRNMLGWGWPHEVENLFRYLEVLEQLEQLPEVEEDAPFPTALFLWGPPGVGKTSYVEAMAKEQGVHLIKWSHLKKIGDETPFMPAGYYQQHPMVEETSMLAQCYMQRKTSKFILLIDECQFLLLNPPWERYLLDLTEENNSTIYDTFLGRSLSKRGVQIVFVSNVEPMDLKMTKPDAFASRVKPIEFKAKTREEKQAILNSQFPSLTAAQVDELLDKDGTTPGLRALLRNAKTMVEEKKN